MVDISAELVHLQYIVIKYAWFSDARLVILLVSHNSMCRVCILLRVSAVCDYCLTAAAPGLNICLIASNPLTSQDSTCFMICSAQLTICGATPSKHAASILAHADIKTCVKTCPMCA